MGLAVEVGLLAHFAGGSDPEALEHYRGQFARLRAAVEAAGVSGYCEPESIPPKPSGNNLGPSDRLSSSFPYSFLQYLRRAYALLVSELPVVPATDPAVLKHDAGVVDDAASMLSSHLLCHSDCEGYYVPVDLPDPLFLVPDSGVAGAGIVGSSPRLLQELRALAPSLGIRLGEGGQLPPAEEDRVAMLAEDDADPWHRELTAWTALFRAAGESVRTGAAIVFC
ncbi:hypothetical protein DFJ74DRAFT_489871 [Hyaloraphidium curvatum]|nr:hypothetical protein DFJ74DRAFT_489871 [Hyaloraphidium curvatum]